MSEDRKTLTERIEAAIGEYFAERGGGFGTAFVCAVEGTTSAGEQCIVFASPSAQGYVTTLGLVEMLAEDARMDARQALAERHSCDCGECSDEED